MSDSGRTARREIEAAEAIAWQALLAHRRGAAPAALVAGKPGGRGAGALFALYGPLLDGPYVVAHLAQSLDGRIACAGGASRWLSGPEDLLHAHRMRALSDAVLVGARTVLHDDPQLTVRHCPGDQPVRVVIDPERRLAQRHRLFRDGAAPTLIITADDRASPAERFCEAELVPLPRDAMGIDPLAIRRALASRGLHRLFIEGGGITISRFLAARALDRLQLTIAPVLLGSGRPGLSLPEITSPHHGLRPRMRRTPLGEDVMFECVFDG
jgi:diaminohydroxyphosphoribosylaminopyrimidine deaminase / 5-amino-6-(5-phosphoribosylamino)uracil reductase